MSFEFEQENFNRNQFTNTSSSSGSAMVDFLIKQGIVKDAATANAILVIGALLGIALSIYFFIFGFSLPQRTPAPVPIAEEGIPSEELEF